MNCAAATYFRQSTEMRRNVRPGLGGPRRAFAFTALILVLILGPAVLAGDHPRNVIIMVGDGMGPAAVAHARFHRFGMAPAVGDNRLHFEQWPAFGLAYTHCANSVVTDSAAAASALFTGRKHRLGALSCDAQGAPLPTIFEMARDRGMAVGVVTTVPITDATPAATFAHTISRRNMETIFQALLGSRFQLLFGAGEGSRYLPRDYAQRARQAGFSVVEDADGLKAANDLPILGIFGHAERFVYERERKQPDSCPRLVDLTEKALALLGDRSDKGFLLLIEGGAIDWAAHANSFANEVDEVLGFESATRAVAEWVSRNSSWNDTLVVVVADHETGELALRLPEDSRFPQAGSETGVVNPGQYAGASYGSTIHSAHPTLVYAKGADCGKFSGVMDNTSIYYILCDILKVKESTANAKQNQ